MGRYDDLGQPEFAVKQANGVININKINIRI